jgi:GGDEF domain-containing protein
LSLSSIGLSYLATTETYSRTVRHVSLHSGMTSVTEKPTLYPVEASINEMRAFPGVLQPPRLRSRDELLADLERAASTGATTRLVIFGLDGFREFLESHDTLEGEELLSELAGRFEEVAGAAGACYRPRHDEFAFLCDADRPEIESLLELALAALSEGSRELPLTAALGSVLVPAEAGSPIEALALADERLAAAQPRRAARERRRFQRPGSERHVAEEAGGGSDSLHAIRAELAQASSSARRVRQVDQLLDVAETLTTLADAARIDDNGHGRLQGMPREPARIPLLLKELALKLAALRALDGPEIAAVSQLVDGSAPNISSLSSKVLSALDEVGTALAAA